MITYTMTATCDGCGKVLEHENVKVTNIAHTRRCWTDKWKDHLEMVRSGRKNEMRIVKGSGVMMVERPYKSALLYCSECADGSPKTLISSARK